MVLQVEQRFRELISLCGGAPAQRESFAETIQRAEKSVHPFINRWCGPNGPSIRAQFQDAVERSRTPKDATEVDEICAILDLVHRQLMHWHGSRERR